ncbi:MAG: hydroxymethylbilane synthase [Bacillaceae bacterium G1]|nr:hydroxymethylbilane synthase [Bacillota bacterium]OJF17993.1 MAG: hydroxymethylbilane synthase [Bacillaceae bacterium G1]
MNPIRIGSRRSELALRQTNWVKERLEQATDRPVVIRTFVTKGDRILDVTLSKVGGKGLFVKEIEDEMLKGGIDLAVHSMKDVPAQLPAGLTLGAVSRREDPRDCWISKHGIPFSQLPSGAKVGTSSLRRQAQIRRLRPDIEVIPLRGNVGTRLRKLGETDLDGIVLAAAGLHRLGWEDQITEYFSPDTLIPAVGQGALGIECREDDADILALLQAVHDGTTAQCVQAERAFLQRLEGSCQVPLGAYARWEDGRIVAEGFVASPDGKQFLRATREGDDPIDVGTSLAEDLLAAGAGDILRRVAAESEIARQP